MALHTGPIQIDFTFGSGNFWKRLPAPKFCFDIAPKTKKAIPADVRNIPLKDNSVVSCVFDPPFMMRTGPGSVLKERFQEIKGTIQDLWDFYFLAMKEIHRVLAPKGWLVFKCQDGVLSGVNNFTHCQIYNIATILGFVPKDLFILLAKNRMWCPTHKIQRHARKFHSYFWVFQKANQ
jgi:hypothetical protein